VAQRIEAAFDRVNKATIIKTWIKVEVPATATFEACKKVSKDDNSNNDNNNNNNDLSTIGISQLKRTKNLLLKTIIQT
jgi:hypothetical protein